MNALHKVSLAVALLAASAALPHSVALADSPLSSTPHPEEGRLYWNCARKGAPSYQELKAAFGVSNYVQAATLQVRVHSKLRGECQRGVDRVLLVVGEPRTPPLTLVASTK
jgi:hypothetical protein